MKDDEQYIGSQEWIGAAIEIGDTQIWAGQILITVVNKTVQNLTLVSICEGNMRIKLLVMILKYHLTRYAKNINVRLV